MIKWLKISFSKEVWTSLFFYILYFFILLDNIVRFDPWAWPKQIGLLILVALAFGAFTMVENYFLNKKSNNDDNSTT